METVVEASWKGYHKGEGEYEAWKMKSAGSDLRMLKDELRSPVIFIRKREGESSKIEYDQEKIQELVQYMKRASEIPRVWDDAIKKDLDLEVSMLADAATKKRLEFEELTNQMAALRDTVVRKGDALVKIDIKGKGKGKGKGKAASKAKRETEAEKMKRQRDEYEQWKKQQEEREQAPDPEEVNDPYAFHARSFEQRWTEIYGRMGYGSFQDKTSIPCKRFTFDPAPLGGRERGALQVFSVKVAELLGGLQWPIDVFGLVALRDSLDHKRNVMFERNRNNCQTLTEANPHLVLTGPVRAVVFSDRVCFEVSLFVRGPAKSDDKELSLLATSILSSKPSASQLMTHSYTSRLSTLDFKLGQIVGSVEATISVKVISAPPDGFYGKFVASTASIRHGILLHNSGDGEVHLVGDEINLSRSVLSVESNGKLTISVSASDGCLTLTGKKDFKPLEMGTSTKVINIASLCQLEATVAWSRFSYQYLE